ncbi:MAG: thioredoxin family protein [Muribaculaceae bacterium]|nr:thioredoxin family protein [Muribaculaceae bacterium]
MFSLIVSILASLSSVSTSTIVEPDSLYVVNSATIDEAEKLREQYRKMMEEKNSVGNQASDFRFITREGEDTSLLRLPTDKNILLIFYDPDCDDCHAAIDSILNSGLGEKLHIVAIDSEEDRNRWEETAGSLPEDWTVGFATDPIQEDETYYILTMPSIYLLDKNKTVLLKDTTLDKVSKYN